ncbi:MAG: S26 family signal peptidase, partial [Terriglobales bacterium]
MAKKVREEKEIEREQRPREKDRKPRETDQKPREADEKPRETATEFLASIAGVLVTGLFIITFILQAFEIPSSSMEDTLLIGDHVFVNREWFAAPTRWVGPLLPYHDPRHG